MAKEDRKTYFLMRNGERLYRFWTSYSAPERLMPREDEFLGYFRDYDGQPIKAGSNKWMKAQKAAADDQMHYRVFFLLLQGLLDRTTIFAPLPGPVSLGNPNTWGTIFQIVRDDERALGEGRERFADWVKRINAKLDVGMRVVGCWRNYTHGLVGYNESKYGNPRTSPRHAELPHENEIYRIDERRGGDLVFHYKRHEENWAARYRYDNPNDDGEFKKRASCIVKPSDSFILNIDAPDVRVDDMRYYLTSRLDRAEYTHMFPVLKVAIAALEAEAAEEAPFRQLLVGQMALVGHVDIAEAETAVDELIRWYKTANRYHRALLTDDAKAIKLILNEYGRRRKLATAGGEITALRDSTLVDDALKKTQDVLLVAQKSDGNYVVLLPENDENVFVCERTVTYPKNVINWRTTEHWRTVGARWQSWRVLYQSPRWVKWNINASPWEHLTDPERMDLAREGWAHEVRRLEAKNAKRKPTDVAYEPLLLAATVSRGGALTLWYRAHPPKAPANVLEYLHEPKVHARTLRCKRDAHRKAMLLPVSEWNDGREHAYLEKSQRWLHAGNKEMNTTGWPWQRKDMSPSEERVLWIEENNLEIARQDKATCVKYQQPYLAFKARVSHFTATVNLAYIKLQEEAAFKKFLDDYGDLELWPGHKKALVIQQTSPYDDGRLQKLITGLLLAGVDPSGMTLAEAHARLVAVGDVIPTDDNDRFHRNWKTKNTAPPPELATLRIGDPPPPTKLHEEDEDA